MPAVIDWELTGEKQQPVDFAIWQASDGTWQVWSCIRQTKCGGKTRLCMELAGMQPSDERFDAKTTVLIENVTHHIDEEEQDWFPKVREGLGRKQLQELGAAMLEAKKTAPRRPEQPSAVKKAIDAVVS